MKENVIYLLHVKKGDPNDHQNQAVMSMAITDRIPDDFPDCEEGVLFEIKVGDPVPIMLSNIRQQLVDEGNWPAWANDYYAIALVKRYIGKFTVPMNG